jgi:hypothetical protein
MTTIKSFFHWKMGGKVCFQNNVDGITTEATNIDIANDSVYVFVQVNVDPMRQIFPLL